MRDLGGGRAACWTNRPKILFRSMWTRATRAILPRTLNSSRNHLNAYSSRPWYVEEDPEPKSPFQEPTTAIKPPPEGIPDHLSTVYSFLATSPYLEPLSLVVGPPDKQADVDLPLPLLKSVRKSRKRVKERGYGVGVSEGPGQGVYNWILMAQVKEGAESRGAIESVSSSLRALVCSLSSFLTDLIIPR